MNKLLRTRAFVGLVFILTLILLSILANMTGWSGGAGKILSVSLILIYAIPIGIFFTEPSGKM